MWQASSSHWLVGREQKVQESREFQDEQIRFGIKINEAYKILFHFLTNKVHQFATRFKWSIVDDF